MGKKVLSCCAPPRSCC